MAAIEHHRDRPLGEQGIETDQAAGLVRQQEGRHHVARPRRVFAAAVFVDARDQPVDRLAIGGKDLAAGRRIGLELLLQGAFHVAALQEGLPEAFGVCG